MSLRSATVVLAAAILLAVPRAALADIMCTGGTMSRSCPDDAPVCCYLTDGTPAGCCPAFTVCDMGTGGCRQVTPVPSDDVAEVVRSASVDVHFSTMQLVGTASVALSIILFVFAMVFASIRLRRWQERQRMRRLLNEEEQSSVVPDDDSVTSEEANEFLRGVAERAAERRPLLAPSGGPAMLACTPDAIPGFLADDESAPASPLRAGGDGEEEEEADDPGPSPLDVGNCTVCKRTAIDAVLVDCGHLVVCFECASHIRYCPSCNSKIRRRKRVFSV